MKQQGSRLTQTCKTPEPLLSIKTNVSCCTSQLQLDLAMECLSCKTCLHLPVHGGHHKELEVASLRNGSSSKAKPNSCRVVHQHWLLTRILKPTEFTEVTFDNHGYARAGAAVYTNAVSRRSHPCPP